MAGKNRITEQVTWLGWALKESGMPYVQHVGSFFNDFSEQRTTRWDVLNERNFKKLRGLQFIRFQMMGYSRLDQAEFSELDNFIYLAQTLHVLPASSKLSHTIVEREPKELGLDGQALKFAAQTELLRDHYSIGFHERLDNKDRAHTYHVIVADLFTLDGLENFQDNLRKFKTV